METIPRPAQPPLAQATALTKTYGSGPVAVHALRGVDVAFAKGQFAAIMGPSGSGKSTLMHCLAGLDRPTSGQVRLGETLVSGLPERHLTALRRHRVGFVFQSFNLVPTLSAIENITLPLDIAHREPDAAWLELVVATLGLKDRLQHRPSELSGGQAQRVACARALAAKPQIVFADEPTGNLDSASSNEVLDFLRHCVDNLGQTLVMVTHDAAAAARADRVVFLADGLVAGEIDHPDVDQVVDALRQTAGRQGASRQTAAGQQPSGKTATGPSHRQPTTEGVVTC